MLILKAVKTKQLKITFCRHKSWYIVCTFVINYVKRPKAQGTEQKDKSVSKRLICKRVAIESSIITDKEKSNYGS